MTKALKQWLNKAQEALKRLNKRPTVPILACLSEPGLAEDEPIGIEDIAKGDILPYKELHGGQNGAKRKGTHRIGDNGKEVAANSITFPQPTSAQAPFGAVCYSIASHIARIHVHL